MAGPYSMDVCDGVDNDQGEKTSDSSDVQNHSVILGWSNKVASLVRQLAVANQSLGGGLIGIVADREVGQMEQDIKNSNIDLLGTAINFYSGDRLDSDALQKACISEARAIIILAESQDPDESDELAVKTIRTILQVLDEDEYKGHIVVELSDIENEDWVKQVGGELVETVAAQDVVGRLMVQCARQPGLAQVWEDILGFDKAEFYIKRWPELDGMRFADVMISFPDAIPCGVKVTARNGKIVLNPSSNYILSEGDEVLVVADDDDSYAPSTSLPEIKVRTPKAHMCQSSMKTEKILFCGWRPGMEDMITILGKSSGPGSELWVFSEMPEDERQKRLAEKGVNLEQLENVSLIHCIGDACSKKDLEDLPLEEFDSILLVPDGDTVGAESGPLTTLILIKSIQSKRLPYREARAVQIRPAGGTQSSWIDELQHTSRQSIIVSEILNVHTKEVIADLNPREIVISDEMVSMTLAMVAEDKQINGVLDELFAEEGDEMLIQPAELYLNGETEELTFYEIMMRVCSRNEIAIGYHRVFKDRPVINPPNKGTRKMWSLDDSFVVLTEKH